MKSSEIKTIKALIKELVKTSSGNTNKTGIGFILSGYKRDKINKVLPILDVNSKPLENILAPVVKGSETRDFLKAVKLLKSPMLTRKGIPKVVVFISSAPFPNNMEDSIKYSLPSLSKQENVRVLFIGFGSAFNKENVRDIIGDRNNVKFLPGIKSFPNVFDDIYKTAQDLKSR